MNKVYVIIFDFNDHMEYESYSVENSFQGIYDSLEKSKKAIEDLVKKDEGFVRDQSKENHFIWEDRTAKCILSEI